MPFPLRKVLRWLALPLGLGLLFSAAYFQEGSALSSERQTDPTPTVDRLAQPTLPSTPSQADLGAQDFWLNCMACHGDRGQGLTDEFRQLYPPEDQNCWISGCHGDRPYDNGFTLPRSIPAVIGGGDFNKFGNAGGVYAYISVAMPWHKPGSLNEETYWRLTAFLVRENGITYPYAELGPQNAQFVNLGAGEEKAVPSDSSLLIVFGALGVAMGLGLGVYWWRRRN